LQVATYNIVFEYVRTCLQISVLKQFSRKVSWSKQYDLCDMKDALASVSDVSIQDSL